MRRASTSQLQKDFPGILSRLSLVQAVVLIVLLVASCSPTRFLAEDEYLLDNVSIRCSEKEIPLDQLGGYIRQHPNARWFSLFKAPMRFYCLSGTDSTRRINRFIQRIGEAPVVYDSVMSNQSREDMQAAVRNLGYLDAVVEVNQRVNKHRVRLNYFIHPGERYYVNSFNRVVDDAVVDSLVTAGWGNSHISDSIFPFDVNLLDRERSRITTQLQDTGFYRFNKTQIRYNADTLNGSHDVDLTMHIPAYRATMADSLSSHPRFRIGRISYLYDIDTRSLLDGTAEFDSLSIRGSDFYWNKSLFLRPNFVMGRTSLHTGSYYRESDVQSTYSNISSLSALVGANITLEPMKEDTTQLHAFVSMISAKRNSVSVELEGTNSAGDLGAAVSLGYQNRNFFRRSTSFGLTLRGAFEAIKGLEGYSDQNYIEYSIEGNLNFPEFMFPFVSRLSRKGAKAQSIASLMYDSQNRPEFHRRVLTAAWRYRWNSLNQKRQQRLDLIDLNYVFMPWISETFSKEYLTDNGSRNAVLRYNYENLFIMRLGYSFQYTSRPATSLSQNLGENAYSVRFAVETGGNLLYAISHLFHAQYSQDLGAYTLFNIAYAEYAKVDFDFSKSFNIDSRNSLALHMGFGVAVPYGNSSILPFEKRYFSGGANSVRGWSVRGLGPGRFSGSDGRVDFIRQTGDLKLDLNAEWRTHLFWKIDGAVFVDAGNVWTLRDYEEQPGGQFRFDTFWKQIAVAYGLGIRLNFGYFILRLDGGMKAVNPAYESGRDHFPIIHPNLKRDFHLHFAVGLPF